MTNQHKREKVAIIVAHPDDETLWAGGTLLSHPNWECFVVCLSRKDDNERKLKFTQALKVLLASGIMGDMDDGPEQRPLANEEVKLKILELMPSLHFDIIITHDPAGEYTRHLRHEEISRAVIHLWNEDKIYCKQLRTFAYEDGNKKYFPRAIRTADSYIELPLKTWKYKYEIMKNVYGFGLHSWELSTTPKQEAFWLFEKKEEAMHWLAKKGKQQ